MLGGVNLVLNHLVTVSMQTAPMVLVAAVIMMSSAARETRLEWLAVAIGLVLLEDFLLTGCWTAVPQPESWGQWNWTGKALALAGSVLVATLPQFGLANCGLTLKQNKGSGIAWLIGGIVCAAMLCVALYAGPGHPQTADTIAFHWTMPGLEEQLFYRGTLLFVLDRAFLARKTILGAEVGPGLLLSAVLLAGFHGLTRHDGNLDIKPLIFGTNLAAGLILGWLRARTGSLLAPLVVQNVGDGVFTLF